MRGFLLEPENNPPNISATEVLVLRTSFPSEPKNPSSALSVSSSDGIKGGLTDLGGF